MLTTLEKNKKKKCKVAFIDFVNEWSDVHDAGSIETIHEDE